MYSVRVRERDVAIEQGMTGFPEMKSGSISTGNDYSYICIRNVEEKLAVTYEVIQEYQRTYGLRPPTMSHELMLGLMNIALRHHQYIEFKEIEI